MSTHPTPPHLGLISLVVKKKKMVSGGFALILKSNLKIKTVAVAPKNFSSILHFFFLSFSLFSFLFILYTLQWKTPERKQSLPNSIFLLFAFAYFLAVFLGWFLRVGGSDLIINLYVFYNLCNIFISIEQLSGSWSADPIAARVDQIGSGMSVWSVSDMQNCLWLTFRFILILFVWDALIFFLE